MLQICRRGQRTVFADRNQKESYYADSKLYDPASGNDSSSEEEVISAPGRDKGPEKPKVFFYSFHKENENTFNISHKSSI